MSRAFVGAPGWRYPRWRGDFYPKACARRTSPPRSRAHEPRSRSTAFYCSSARPPTRPGATRPADGFVFAVKGGRFITHLKRLHDVKTPLANFFASGVLSLGQARPDPLAAPERTRFDPDRLAAFFELLPRTTTAAADLAERHDDKIPTTAPPPRPSPEEGPPRARAPPRELRHAEARAFIAEHDVCTVVADSAGRWPQMHDATSDFRYVRLHGETELYASGYTDESPTAGPARSGAGSPTDTTPTSTSTTTPRATPLTTPSPS